MAQEGGSGLSPLDATALLCTWSTSSSNVMYPFTFGVLGVAGGPALMLVAFAVNGQCTRWTVRAARRTGARTLGDLGDHLWGAKGRLLLEGSQILFQQLFLPVALVLSAQATQSLLAWDCNGSAVLCFVALGFALGASPLSQRLQHSVGLAYVSIALILVQTTCIAWAVSATPPPRTLDGPRDEAEAAGAPFSSRWEWVVGAGNGDGQHAARYQWHNVAAALGVFIYSCLPNCIAVETQAALRPGAPRRAMDSAVDASFAFYIAIYLATGLPAVLGAWGADVPIPVTSVMRNDPAGVLTKLILVYSTMLDFVLASVTVNRFLVARHFDPAFFRDGEASATVTPATAAYRRDRALRWAWYSLPSLLVAMAFALLIPRLESLTGLLNSITGTTVQLTAVVLCLYMAPQGAEVVDSGEEEEEEEEEEGGQGSTRFYSSSSISSSSGGGSNSHSKQPASSTATSAISLRRRYAVIGTYGGALTALIFSEALYSIVFLTDYSAENFWCDVDRRR